MERFLMELSKRDNLGAIQELLNHCREVIETYIRAQMEAGADGSSIGDSIAGPDVCNPDFYREFALPQEKRLFENLKKDYSRPISLHICGDATNIVPEMIESGTQILELDYKIDQKKVRKMVEGRLAFLGPLDPVLLGSGSPEEVHEKTKELLSLWGDHDGLIFGPGCAMNAGTPEENVKSMIAAVREFTPGGEEGGE
jgi:uroporphyrinogen decarboxylase